MDNFRRHLPFAVCTRLGSRRDSFHLRLPKRSSALSLRTQLQRHADPSRSSAIPFAAIQVGNGGDMIDDIQSKLKEMKDSIAKAMRSVIQDFSGGKKRECMGSDLPVDSANREVKGENDLPNQWRPPKQAIQIRLRRADIDRHDIRVLKELKFELLAFFPLAVLLKLLRFRKYNFRLACVLLIFNSVVKAYIGLWMGPSESVGHHQRICPCICPTSTSNYLSTRRHRTWD